MKVPENVSTEKDDTKKEPAAKPSKSSKGVASGSPTSTGGSREGNAGHTSEQSGNQGRR
ncbi:MAG TPA: hypothetical protein VD884_04900 [Ohtaekwangia sp.]|nr:hypothetical protein [Ohtaekwangia sp.]